MLKLNAWNPDQIIYILDFSESFFYIFKCPFKKITCKIHINTVIAVPSAKHLTVRAGMWVVCMINIIQKKCIFLTTEKSSLTCQIIRMHGVSFPCDFFKSLASVSPHSNPLNLSACWCVTHSSPLFNHTLPHSSMSQSGDNHTRIRCSVWLPELPEENRVKIQTGDQQRHLVARSRSALRKWYRRSLDRFISSNVNERFFFYFISFVFHFTSWLCVAVFECASCVVLWVLITLYFIRVSSIAWPARE